MNANGSYDQGKWKDGINCFEGTEELIYMCTCTYMVRLRTPVDTPIRIHPIDHLTFRKRNLTFALPCCLLSERNEVNLWFLMLILENSQVSDATVHKEDFFNGAFFIFHIIQSNKDLWDPPNQQLRNIFSCISSIHWTTEIYISLSILFAEGEVNIGDIFTHLAHKWDKRSLKNIIASTCSLRHCLSLWILLSNIFATLAFNLI